MTDFDSLFNAAIGEVQTPDQPSFILCWVLYTYGRRRLTYVGEDDPGPVPCHLAKRQMGVPSTLNPNLWGSYLQEALND